MNAEPQHFTHYAIYDFIVKGSCFCNGHADQCIPIDGFRPVKAPGAFHVVHGKCICKHNTAGTHCQHCAPLYNDRPWEAADGKQGLQMSAEPASAMDMLTPVTLTLMCGRHQGIVVAASAMTVSTTQKVNTASDVSQASTGTSEDLSLPQMLANRVPVIQLDQLSFLSAR